MKRLLGFDLALLGYLGIVGLLLAVAQPPGTALLLGFHVAGAGLILAIAWAHGRFGGRFWGFVRHWYVVPAAMACFRELYVAVPAVHPFEDLRWDRALAALDARWFGDVDGFFLGLLSPVLADLLELCYSAYFFLILAVPIVLQARGERERLDESVTVLTTAVLLTYLGYFAVPALGPQVFLRERPPILDGWLLAGSLHRGLASLELRTADAFPSGHTLMSITALLLAWRHSRRTFAAILAPALGCIAATVALRYHYAVDLLAAAALFPASTALGFAVHRAAADRRRTQA
jgi:hypothetical protein